MIAQVVSTQLFSSQLLALLREREQDVSEATLETIGIADFLVKELPALREKNGCSVRGDNANFRRDCHT
jgi:hypothetical protein